MMKNKKVNGALLIFLLVGALVTGAVFAYGNVSGTRPPRGPEIDFQTVLNILVSEGLMTNNEYVKIFEYVNEYYGGEFNIHEIIRAGMITKPQADEIKVIIDSGRNLPSETVSQPLELTLKTLPTTEIANANYEAVEGERYVDNGNGTVTDKTTGLMWQQNPGDKKTYDEAVNEVDDVTIAGYDDWRFPTITELYSLIDFESGVDPSLEDSDTSKMTPFLDTDYFDFVYGDSSKGERVIDSQYMSATKYVSTTMNGDETVFGVNFADGRIKGYGVVDPRTRTDKEFFVMYVRGESQVGINAFIDNGDGTIVDLYSDLMWMEVDSGFLNEDGGMNWYEAQDWAADLEYAGYSDWRVPTAIELQGIVDYTKSPSTTYSAAIDSIFETSEIIDEDGSVNYPWYWTSDSHNSSRGSSAGVYVAFGEALGYMSKGNNTPQLMDVHGAGAQRSDPKSGDASDYKGGRGPQGDVVRIDNYVRLVRDISN